MSFTAFRPPGSGGSNEAALLASAYRTALDIAKERRFSTVAVPCLSRGIHRYPAEAAAAIAWNTVLSHPFDGKLAFVTHAEVDTAIYRLLYEAVRAAEAFGERRATLAPERGEAEVFLLVRGAEQVEIEGETAAKLLDAPTLDEVEPACSWLAAPSRDAP